MLEYGYPFTGKRLAAVRGFLHTGGLDYEDGIQFSVNLLDETGSIIATGSRQENVFKCILVAQKCRGTGLTAKIITALYKDAADKGIYHLFLFTKPGNKIMFRQMGFFDVAETDDMLLMENKRDGIKRFVKSLGCPTKSNSIGAVVCNCNPFTKGHLYLIESAAEQCSLLHVFILSEDKSIFPADVRYALVKEGIAHIKNAVVHPTSDYLISSATFPEYFIRDKLCAKKISCRLDCTIFRDCFAKPMGIGKRFIGTEPYSKVTQMYNSQMKEFFKGSFLKIIEIERKIENGKPISASSVRCLLASGQLQEASQLLPQVTRQFLQTDRGKEIINGLMEVKAHGTCDIP